MTKTKEAVALEFERKYQRFYEGSEKIIPFPASRIVTLYSATGIKTIDRLSDRLEIIHEYYRLCRELNNKTSKRIQGYINTQFHNAGIYPSEVRACQKRIDRYSHKQRKNYEHKVCKMREAVNREYPDLLT